MSDLRYALRTLRNQPLFTAAAVLTLALGIGANTAIFGVLYQVVLRPLPYPEPDRLVFVWNAYQKAGSEPSDVAIPDYLDRRMEAPSIEDAALFTPRPAILSISGTPEQVLSLAVTPSFFTTLRRGPLLGRAFDEDDGRIGHDDSVILTHAFWRSHFGGDPRLIGRSIRINGAARTVVGILAADFDLPVREASLLVPFAFTPAQLTDAERGNEFSRMIARLRPRATIGQLDSEMRTIVDRLMTRVPSRAAYMRNSGFTGVAVDMRTQMVGDARTSLYLLQGGVVLVLLIACANVANLLLMRATGRRRELAVRAAIGASPGRLVRQLFIEGLVLSTFGGACGLVLGVAGSRGLVAMLGENLPRPTSGGLPAPVLIFTMAVATIAGVIFAMAPALSILRGTPAAALENDGSRGSSSRGTGFARRVLVVCEVALAVILLAGAGLLARSLARITEVKPGFSADRVLTAQLALPPARYPDAVATRAFWHGLLDKARAIPGVVSAGLISELPFSDTLSSGTYTIVGRPLGAGERPPHGGQSFIAGDYFRAMRIPLLDGRFFDERDGPDAERVVVVDEMLAKRQFPGERAVGRQINFGSRRNYTIVGVVGTVHAADLAKDVPEERLYLSAEQLPESRMALVARTGVDTSAIVAQLRSAVAEIDPQQPIAGVRNMDQWIARSLTSRRTPTTLLSLFGLVALLLSAIGIYGVMAFGVAQRTREFGIRRALGADRASILSLVFVHGLRTAGAGLALGLAGALAVSRSFSSLLFGVAPYDPFVLGSVCGMLLLVAAVACYIPARGATRVEPLAALREN